MDCCSSGCDKAGMQIEEIDEPRVMAAAEKLAFLLVETAEYQAFARASHAVQFDQEVSSLVNQLNGCRGEAEAAETQARLEALPVVQAYRQAEAAIRALLGAVDGAISEAAGVDFAVNAAASACG